MRRIFIPVFCLCISSVVQAQPDADSTVLVNRLHTYMQYSKNMEFEKLMDFLHPSIFTLATRKELLKAMKDMYDTEELSIAFDSMAISAISAVFLHANTEYRRVDYYSVLTMQFLGEEKEDTDSVFVDFMILALKKEFPAQEVLYRAKDNKFVVKGNDRLVAIKDPGTEWMFLGVEKENPLLMKLFPAKVISHFRLKE